MTAVARWIERKAEDGAEVLYLSGHWRLPNLAAIAQALEPLRQAFATPPASPSAHAGD